MSKRSNRKLIKNKNGLQLCENVIHFDTNEKIQVKIIPRKRFLPKATIIMQGNTPSRMIETLNRFENYFNALESH